MRSVKILLLVCLACWPVAAGAASLEGARELYSAGDLTAAAQELDALLAATSDDTERAAALSLAGDVAVRRARWDEATARYAALLGAYPESSEAAQAQVKLALLHELQAAPDHVTGSAAEAARPAIGELKTVPVPPAAPSPAPPAAASIPALADAAPAPAAITVGPRTVLIAGLGTPYDAVQQAVARLEKLLVAGGVEVASATSGVPVVPDSKTILPLLLDATRQRGGVSLLLVEAQFGFREKVLVSCYQPDGGLLWQEKVSGTIGHSKIQMNPVLVERIERKLEPHLGGPGLPRAD